MSDLSGLSAFPITPSDNDGRVDTAALRRLIAPLRLAGVDSIGVLGSTGSYPYLSREERCRALDAALEEAGAVPVLVGVGALRTDEAVRIAQDAKAAGATAGLLAPVSYTPLDDAEIFEHFSAVARESGLPLCIYDNPSTTHFRFRPQAVIRTVAKLARRRVPCRSHGGCSATLPSMPKPIVRTYRLSRGPIFIRQFRDKPIGNRFWKAENASFMQPCPDAGTLAARSSLRKPSWIPCWAHPVEPED